MRTEARFPAVPERAGHYESFYLKLCPPGGGRAAWIRHTVHKRPSAPATASLWFTLFDARAPGPRATKETYPSDRLSLPDGAYLRIADAELRDGSAVGKLGTPALDASWNLRFADDHEPFFHLPRRWLYRAPLPRTKFLSPYPNARFDGELSVGGERIAVEGWRGMVGHNWGAEHAERWVWVEGAGLDGRPESDYFDMAAGRIKVAGLSTPWVANGMLVLDGNSHRLGGFERVPSTEIAEEATSCAFRLRGRGVKVSGRVGAQPKDFVAWVYADPDGAEHNTLNCSISNLQLDVQLEGGPTKRLTVRGAAAYEIGMRETDHGIPLQPYPDG